MNKIILILLLVSFAGLGAVKAQNQPPVWLVKLRLAGLAGSADHPLAIIGNHTFATGETNTVNVGGRKFLLKCLEIGQTSVRVQIEDQPFPYELFLSGGIVSLAPPSPAPPTKAVTTIQPPIPIPTPLPIPPRFNPSSVDPRPLAGQADIPPNPMRFFWGSFIGGGVLIGIFLLLVLGAAMAKASSQVAEKDKNVGEALVAEMIAQHFKAPHHLINNITLPIDDGTTQIDHVLITGNGVFVIETKHYSGWIFGRAQDSQWTRQHFHSKIRFQNPLRQNYGHVKALQSLFDLPSEVFHSLVVFTGEAKFKTDLGPDVVCLSGLLSFLSAVRPMVFDEAKMASIVGSIEMKRLCRSVETDEYHINHVRRKIARKIPQPPPAFLSPSRVAQTGRPTALEHPHGRYMPKG